MITDYRKLDATLCTRDGHAEVMLSYRGSGERVGSRVFATLDEALDWLAAMKWDYKVAA